MFNDEIKRVGKPDGLSKFALNEKGVFLDGKRLNGVISVVIRAEAGELDEVTLTMRVDSGEYAGDAHIDNIVD